MLFNQSSNISWLGHSLMKNYKYAMQKKWFRETIRLPFENVMVPVPVDYEEVLKSIYGDWHKFVRDGHGDERVIYSTDIPYKKFFQCADLNFILQGRK